MQAGWLRKYPGMYLPKPFVQGSSLVTSVSWTTWMGVIFCSVDFGLCKFRHTHR